MSGQTGRRNRLTRVLQPWWRLTRGLTLGAQGVIIDESGQVLLVRHGYRPGWHFPGGGVERGETLADALSRELREETGVILSAPAELHGVFSNNTSFAGDHIAVFIIRQWSQPDVPKPNAEIAEQGFFAPGDVPATTDAGTLRRIAEIFDTTALRDEW